MIFLNVLSRANSLITNSNISSVTLEIKMADVIVKIGIFRSPS